MNKIQKFKLRDICCICKVNQGLLRREAALKVSKRIIFAKVHF